MRRPRLLIAAAASSLLTIGLGGLSRAQVVAPATTAPPPAVQPTPATPRLGVAPAGTPILIELGQPISTKAIHKGDMFAIRVAKPVIVDGKELIPAKATGMGQVVDAGRPGVGGKPAKLILAARYIDVGSQRVALHGMKFGAVGADHTTEAMLVSELPYVGVLGFFVTGGEIEISEGALAIAKLTNDFDPAGVGAIAPATIFQATPAAAKATPGSSAPATPAPNSAQASPKGL